MPELGKYAFAVLASYGVTILLVGGLVALSLWQAARSREALRRAEEREGRRG